MALVGEVVARFKAETSDYLRKIDDAKQKNKELAAQLIETAGSADKAMGTLVSARKVGALGDLGLDPRQMTGVMSAIKEIDKSAHQGAGGFAEMGHEAHGLHNIIRGTEAFMRGDFLNGIRFAARGMKSLQEGTGEMSQGMMAALGVTVAGIAGKELAHLTEQAKELHEQFVTGKISAGEMGLKLAESIPVLGNFVSIGHNVTEIFSDWSGQLARAIEYEKELNAEGEKLLKTQEEQLHAKTGAMEGTEDLDRDTRIRGLKAAGLTGSAAYEEIAGEAQKKFRDFNRNEIDKYNKQIAELGARYDKIMNTPGGLIGHSQESYDIAQEIERLKEERDKLQEDRRRAIEENAQAKFSEKFGGMSAQEADAAAMADQLGKKMRDGITHWFKESPVSKWVKDQLEQGKKEAEQYAREAERFKEEGKSNADKLGEQLDEAQHLKNMGFDSDPVGFARNKARQLIAERDQILSKENEHDAYHLPDIHELRAGQMLYAPPTVKDDRQIEELKKINDSLDVIKKKEPDALNVDEVSV